MSGNANITGGKSMVIKQGEPPGDSKKEVVCCMTTKAEKPTLQGQRIKTRKRDEKAKYDPVGFRDAILQGLIEAGSDLEAVNKYLDQAGSKLKYRTYGETLFDILIAGGILTPGGGISEDGIDSGPVRTDMCVFGAPDDSYETLRGYATVFTRLMRRYKYLEKMFYEEMKKVLVYLKGFRDCDRIRLARCVAIWTSDSLLDPKVLATLLQDHLIKDGLAADFLCEVLLTAKNLKDLNTVRSLLRKAGLDSRLMEFLQANKRTDENFKNLFQQKGLEEILGIYKNLEKETSLKELQIYLSQQVNEGASVKDIIVGVQEIAKKNSIQEPQIVSAIWSSVMDAVEWNKKEELVADQALKHLRVYAPLFAANTTTDRAELNLLVKVQEFCYDNMNFMKVFQKIVILFYKSEVLSEEVILKWYKEGHATKGKSIFLDQLKKFIEWLQNAEEESEESGEEEED
ncbi:eIF5-mimic protein 2 isoform X1 [Procambarus clarkii]|uniref:eIF5-mimic protein 2 isoform X1 n=2 Tax=Procambarus clarkii TaxID=6728 RepID=UPI001E670135|nr:basic leucine zipper and W2 domain-containing protein 1-like isoform X1 [Procambarus clarkii]XP_045620156.1 basic leucine zipper and W2 domain-containing protein 1-like isoform X1 [Procambarus clarkii]